MMTIQSSSKTDVFIDELPDDLLLTILYKLPAKSAVQCKAVCKHWLFLISGPEFIQQSIRNHQQPYESLSFIFQYRSPITLLYRDRDTINFGSVTRKYCIESKSSIPRALEFVPCFREEGKQRIRVLASFNDLVCCESPAFERTYFICNPITKQWLKLPPAPAGNDPNSKFKVGFVCYPHARYTSFKLVRIPIYRRLHYEFKAEIFCSETGKWSPSIVSSPQALMLLDPNKVLVQYNGILHWTNLSNSIVAYDPLNKQKQCRIIDSPASDNSNPIECIGVCRGRLRISKLHGFRQINYSQSSMYSLRVWELEDYNAGKWRLVHKVCLKDMISEDMMPRIRRGMIMVLVVAFHPLDDDVVYLNFEQHLASFNVRSRKLEVVSSLDYNIQSFFWGYFFPIVHPWWPTCIAPLPQNA